MKVFFSLPPFSNFQITIRLRNGVDLATQRECEIPRLLGPSGCGNTAGWRISLSSRSIDLRRNNPGTFGGAVVNELGLPAGAQEIAMVIQSYAL